MGWDQLANTVAVASGEQQRDSYIYMYPSSPKLLPSIYMYPSSPKPLPYIYMSPSSPKPPHTYTCINPLPNPSHPGCHITLRRKAHVCCENSVKHCALWLMCLFLCIPYNDPQFTSTSGDFSCSVMSDSCNSMDCSPPGSSGHGISQAGILEWVAIPFSRGIFLTQGLNLGLLNCKWILSQMSHQGTLFYHVLVL